MILEAMHNCIAHQRYQSNSRIIVTEKEDSLEFWNAGDFYEGKYEDYIEGKKTPKKYRNPFLVQAMNCIKMIDSQGYGIHTMFTRVLLRFLNFLKIFLAVFRNFLKMLAGPSSWLNMLHRTFSNDFWPFLYTFSNEFRVSQRTFWNEKHRKNTGW